MNTRTPAARPRTSSGSAALVVFGALAVASAGYLASGFGGAATAPGGSDSALGNALLTEHFPQSAANPTVIVLRLRQPVWAATATVAAAERQLTADPQFTAVSGPFDANGTALTAPQYAALHEIEEFVARGAVVVWIGHVRTVGRTAHRERAFLGQQQQIERRREALKTFVSFNVP